MGESVVVYAGIMAAGVFISSVSQAMLKKAAMGEYPSLLKEYLNPLVVTAYGMFFSATILSVLAYRVIPLSLGSVLESTSYLYITVFGVWIFHERLTARRMVSLALILGGILVFSFLG